jgi:hypothetical protein
VSGAGRGASATARGVSGRNGTAHDAQRSAPLWPWLVAFAAHRALVAWLGFDGVFFWEESYRLLVAEALRDGWPIPVHELQADPYSGGSLVFSALTALATLLAPSSILTLKGVAIAWNTAGLAMWMLVAERVAGRPAAHLSGLLWLVAPPAFVVFNTMGMGFHPDTIPLAGLQFLLLLGGPRETPRLDPARVAWWGFAGGFGCWFCYTSLIPFATGAVFALAAGRIAPRGWILAVAAFVFGFSPWIAHHFAAGGSAEVVAQTFGGSTGGPGGYLVRLYDLTVRGFPVALYFRDLGVPRPLLSYAWLAVYAASFAGMLAPWIREVAVATRSRVPALRATLARHPELAILAVLPAVLVVMAASNQELNDYGRARFFTFRVAVTALPSALFAIAGTASRLRSGTRFTVLAFCTLTGIIGTAQLLADGNAGRVEAEATIRKTGAEAMGHLIVFKHGTDPVFAKIAAAMPNELQESVYRGLGFSFAHLYGTRRIDDLPAGLTTALRSVAPPHRGAALRGARDAIGRGLAQVAPLPPSPRRDELAAAIELAAAY